MSSPEYSKSEAANGSVTARRPNLAILNYYSAERSETFIRAHIERLPARVRVLYGGHPPVMFDDGRPLLSPRLGWRRLRRGLLRKFGMATDRELYEEGLVHFLKENRIAALLAEFGTSGASVFDACRRAGVPLIVHFHGYDAYRVTALEEFGARYPEMFRSAAAVIAVSHHMERQLVSLGCPEDRLWYNPYGVDMARFGRGRGQARPPRFVSVGRFVEKKAPHLTVSAFARVAQEVPAARLVMMGDGPLLDSCRDLARGLGVAETVEFAGAVPHERVAGEMRQARGFVQHSIRAADGDCEGTPVAVLEAQASGLPVVATRHAGIPDVIIEEETGLLVNEHDVAGMAAAMIRLARDPELAQRMGAAGRQRIEDSFTLERHIAELWRIIEQAIRTNRGGAP